MSLDIDLTIDVDTGGEAPHRITLADKNYTHNVTPMWRLVGVYDALYESDGQTASETLPALRAGVAAMSARIDECRALNPSNGWGNADSALTWLREWLAVCEANPKARIGVSR